MQVFQIESVGYSVNMLCGSGMKSTMIGAQDILTGEAELVSNRWYGEYVIAPYMLDKARFGYRMGSSTVVDHMIRDGLTDVFNDYHMGVTAENLAEKYGISRLEQDEFALKARREPRKRSRQEDSKMKSSHL